MRILAALVLLVLVLPGCQSSKGDFCDVARPLRLSPNAIDKMSDQEVEEALSHNEYGAKACGWKARQ